MTVFEKTRGFRGTYHLLMGTLSRCRGSTTTEDQGLLGRVATAVIEEVLIATILPSKARRRRSTWHVC